MTDNPEIMRAQQDIVCAYLCRSVLDYIVQSWLPTAAMDPKRGEAFVKLNYDAPPIADSVTEYCLATLDPRAFDAFMHSVQILLKRVEHSMSSIGEFVREAQSLSAVLPEEKEEKCQDNDKPSTILT